MLAVFFVSLIAASVASAATVATKRQSACAVWAAVRDDLIANRFDGGECGEEAHETLRLTFHDAIGFSRSRGLSAGGGADGSIITFSDIEGTDPSNLGTEDAVEAMRDFATRHNTTFGDMIQFAGAVAVAQCPGAPRLEFFAGRPPATVPAALGIVPDPEQSVSVLISRFRDAGLSSDELVALLASHTVAAQDHVDPAIAGSPFDSTPGLFDSQFFVETQLKGTAFPGPARSDQLQESPLAGEMRLASDGKLARDARTACTWQSFVNQQARMQRAFKAAMAKMAVLGHDKRRLVDCSSEVPVPPAFNRAATLPAGKTQQDIEQACATTPFPTLATDPGATTSVAPVPPS